MKVISKPKVSSPKDLIQVDFEFEGSIYPLRIHQYGSQRHFHASRTYLNVNAKTKIERLESYLKFTAALIEGWDSESNDFFGGDYSGSFAESICLNPDNSWLVNAIQNKLDAEQKKPLAPENG